MELIASHAVLALQCNFRFKSLKAARYHQVSTLLSGDMNLKTKLKWTVQNMFWLAAPSIELLRGSSLQKFAVSLYYYKIKNSINHIALHVELGESIAGHFFLLTSCLSHCLRHPSTKILWDWAPLHASCSHPSTCIVTLAGACILRLNVLGFLFLIPNVQVFQHILSSPPVFPVPWRRFITIIVVRVLT